MNDIFVCVCGGWGRGGGWVGGMRTIFNSFSLEICLKCDSLIGLLCNQLAVTILDVYNLIWKM